MGQRIASFRGEIGRGLTALVLVLLISAMLAKGAVAHGSEVLVKSNPPAGTVLTRPPSRVTAWFSTELDTHLSALQVFDTEGRQVDNGDGGVDLNVRTTPR